MPIQLHIEPLSYPTRGAFKISRSSITEVHVIQVTLCRGDFRGRGECRPYSRYNQDVESESARLESVRDYVEAGDMETALRTLPSSPARNALESAWIDLRAKQGDQSSAEILNVASPRPRQTAFTLSWGTVEEMVEAANAASAYPWLKIKIGGTGLDHVMAVAKARPDAQLIIDANEALSPESLPAFLKGLSGLNIALIEQPLPADHAEDLPETDLTVCADEGLHSIEDLARLWGQGYRAVNVKLDKCGGPSAARDLILKAKEMGFHVMAGCMVGSSLAMAPILTLESLCDVIDLDGPLLLAHDIEDGLVYEAATVFPPNPNLWG